MPNFLLEQRIRGQYGTPAEREAMRSLYQRIREKSIASGKEVCDYDGLIFRCALWNDARKAMFAFPELAHMITDVRERERLMKDVWLREFDCLLNSEYEYSIFVLKESQLRSARGLSESDIQHVVIKPNLDPRFGHTRSLFTCVDDAFLWGVLGSPNRYDDPINGETLRALSRAAYEEGVRNRDKCRGKILESMDGSNFSFDLPSESYKRLKPLIAAVEAKIKAGSYGQTATPVRECAPLSDEERRGNHEGLATEPEKPPERGGCLVM